LNFFRRFVAGIAVRVVLHRQAAIGLFQVCFAGASLDTQYRNNHALP
jgi:hypothetical protein